MTRTILLASGLSLGHGTAQAAPRLVGGGEGSHVEYGGEPGNSPVGGGHVTLAGGGADRSAGDADLRPQPGRAGMLAGGGGEMRLIDRPDGSASGHVQGVTASHGG